MCWLLENSKCTQITGNGVCIDFGNFESSVQPVLLLRGYIQMKRAACSKKIMSLDEASPVTQIPSDAT